MLDRKILSWIAPAVALLAAASVLAVPALARQVAASIPAGRYLIEYAASAPQTAAGGTETLLVEYRGPTSWRVTTVAHSAQPAYVGSWTNLEGQTVTSYDARRNRTTTHQNEIGVGQVPDPYFVSGLAAYLPSQGYRAVQGATGEAALERVTGASRVELVFDASTGLPKSVRSWANGILIESRTFRRL